MENKLKVFNKENYNICCSLYDWQKYVNELSKI